MEKYNTKKNSQSNTYTVKTTIQNKGYRMLKKLGLISVIASMCVAGIFSSGSGSVKVIDGVDGANLLVNKEKAGIYNKGSEKTLKVGTGDIIISQAIIFQFDKEKDSILFNHKKLFLKDGDSESIKFPNQMIFDKDSEYIPSKDVKASYEEVTSAYPALKHNVLIPNIRNSAAIYHLENSKYRWDTVGSDWGFDRNYLTSPTVFEQTGYLQKTQTGFKIVKYNKSRWDSEYKDVKNIDDKCISAKRSSNEEVTYCAKID